MTKSYLTHLTTICVIHVLILMGSWHISQTEYFKATVSSVGNGVLKLKVASDVFTSAVSTEKKTVKTLPINPLRPKISEPVAITTPQVGATGGSTKGSEFGTSEKGAIDVMSIYKAELRTMINKNKSYPPMSRRLGQTGIVVVGFTLLEDGHIIDVKIVKPSPFERLNDSAVEAVKKVERFKPLPKETEGKMVITVPIKFSII